MNTMAIHRIGRSILRGTDLPARESLELARRSPLHLAGRAMLGVGTTALACALTEALGGGPIGRADGLLAALEALLLVVPAGAIFAGYTELRAGPRVLVAASALGLSIGGLAALCILPLLAFFQLVSQVRTSLPLGFELLVPLVALGGVAATVSRVLRAIDERPRAQWLAQLFVTATFVAYSARCWAQLRELVQTI